MCLGKQAAFLERSHVEIRSLCRVSPTSLSGVLLGDARDPSKPKVTFGSLYASRPTVIVFLRRWVAQVATGSGMTSVRHHPLFRLAGLAAPFAECLQKRSSRFDLPSSLWAARPCASHSKTLARAVTRTGHSRKGASSAARSTSTATGPCTTPCSRGSSSLTTFSVRPRVGARQATLAEDTHTHSCAGLLEVPKEVTQKARAPEIGGACLRRWTRLQNTLPLTHPSLSLPRQLLGRNEWVSARWYLRHCPGRPRRS